MKKYILYLLLFILGIIIGYLLCSQTPSSKTPPVCDALTNISPKSGDKVTSPITVTVTIDNTKTCKWTVFEAQAGTMEVKDTNGQILGTGTLTTTSEWMTDQPVEYTGTISLSGTPATNDIVLTIKEDDPSGQGSQEVTIPLIY